MATTVNCHSVRDALAEYLIANTNVQQVRDSCVVTLPLETLDRRLVDVFIEPRNVDFYVIHDGGKAVNELILQGMKITPSVERGFHLLANRLGVTYSDEMFQGGGKIDRLAAQAYSVGMCSALAMTQLLEHVSAVEEESIEGHVGTMLRRWGRNRAKVTENVKVAGEIKQHVFDFLVSPRKGSPIALSVIYPTSGALAAAERFGFKTKDLETTEFAKWKRIALEVKSEIWSSEARRVIERCADAVIAIPSGELASYEQVSNALDRVA